MNRVNALKSYKYLGDRLRVIRHQKELLQVDVAILTGLHSSYISKIEKGKARVTFRHLERLIKGLKINSSDFLDF